MKVFSLVRRCLETVAALVVILVVVAATRQASPSPAAVFVTWNGDPTTTVSIDWHLDAGVRIPALELRGPGMPSWKKHEGDSLAFPFSTRTVRRVQLTGLRPGATYELRIGGSRVYKYRTMPATLTRPLAFAAGGDTQADEQRFGPMNRVAAARDVDFVYFGGDLAYSNGDPRLVAREQSWYETITRTLITADGRLIPVIAAIGNHEVFSDRDTTPESLAMIARTGVKLGDSPYYSALHAHAKAPHYRVIDVGNYLSLVLLNTNHTAPVAGAQTAWLDTVLAKRAQVPHVFPNYHVPGYPSVRSPDGGTSRLVREHWAPLFERHGVRVAFENHDHAYKRTVPIRGGKRDSTGVVYIGDGSWGAGPRVLGRDHKEEAWYIDQSQSANHGIIVTLNGAAARFEVVDTDGAPLDSYSSAPGSIGRTPPTVVVDADFFTATDTTLNLDSPAVWHGPAGQHWLLTSAKTGDRVRIDDAATGKFVADIGTSGSGVGQMRRPNGLAVIDSLLFVVERDNARVQVFSLPTRRSVATFGEGVLQKPYGISIERRAGGYTAFVTDNYETAEGIVPADSLLGRRLQQFQVAASNSLTASTPKAFGGTDGEAVARIVESIAVDTDHDQLLVAEEDEKRSHVKVYTRAGRFVRNVPHRLFPTQAEGIALYSCGKDGYVVMTDQSHGANAFHVFRRRSLEHVGTFRVPNVTNTDGIAISARRFGKFEAGAFYAVDNDGRVAAVSWRRIAAALKLAGCQA